MCPRNTVLRFFFFPNEFVFSSSSSCLQHLRSAFVHCFSKTFNCSWRLCIVVYDRQRVMLLTDVQSDTCLLLIPIQTSWIEIQYIFITFALMKSSLFETVWLGLWIASLSSVSLESRNRINFIRGLNDSSQRFRNGKQNISDALCCSPRRKRIRETERERSWNRVEIKN